MPTIIDKISVDTNVLIYLHDDDDHSGKRNKANELIATGPFVSPQVISEYLNVCYKRLRMTKQDALTSLITWLPYCELSLAEPTVYTNALRLIQKYQFQMFDAIIVSSALASGCSILYSEDMHHNLIVDKQLRILNPFVLNS